MYRIVIAAVVLLMLAGCGTQADPRLMVTDRLRQACAAWGATEESLISLLQLAEDDRVNKGATFTELYLYSLESCNQRGMGEADAAACQFCVSAIINQVYGL